MAGKRKAPLWRQAFLRALRRTGNVRASAFEAGVDTGTTYDHRTRDAGFRAAWVKALARYKEKPSPRPSPAGGRGGRAGGEELVLRRSKAGDKMVRAAAGRWSARVEESFLDALEQTGCVRTAAASIGFSTNALYARRDRYPEFAARWDERKARFAERLPELLNAAAVASLSPAPEGAARRGRARLPAMNMDQSLRLHALNENAKARAQAGARRRGGERARRPEEEHEELVQKVAALIRMKRHGLEQSRLAEGWTDAGGGVWVPPGWVRQAPEEGGADEEAGQG